MRSPDSLRDQWASLGIAFSAKQKVDVDPETALVSLVTAKEFPEDKKMISLALCWLKEYSSFVHIEKLKSQLTNLDTDSLAILGGISLKCIRFGDHRWRTIESIVNRRVRYKKASLRDDKIFLESHGVDIDFLKFGIQVTPVTHEDNRKLLARKRVMQMNTWLKMRLLFGTNLRADIAAVKVLRVADTAYAAAKLLGCSMNAAYRNWNDLTEAGWAK